MPPAVVPIMIGMAAVSAAASIKQGMDAKSAANSQAVLYQQQAQQERLNYGQKIVGEDEKAGAMVSSNEAASGASGVTSSGSPSLVNKNDLTEQKIRDMYTKYGGESAARGLDYQSTLAKWQGNQALYSGFIGAATGAAGTAANIGILKAGGGGI